MNQTHENNYRRLEAAARIARALAQGEFRTTTREEAEDLGWEADSDTPEVFIDGPIAAILNSDRSRIEWCDETGNVWIIATATGEMTQG